MFDRGTLVPTLLISGLFIASGVHGSFATASCERAQRRHYAWLRGPKVKRRNGASRSERERKRQQHLLKMQRARAQEQKLRERELCARGKAELARATSVDHKLELARRRPKVCR